MEDKINKQLDEANSMSELNYSKEDNIIPVYSTAYAYKNKHYNVLING